MLAQPNIKCKLFFVILSEFLQADRAAEVLDHVAGGADHLAQAFPSAALVGQNQHAERRADHHPGAHALQKVHRFHIVPPCFGE